MNLLTALLNSPVTVRVLVQEHTSIGFVRKTVLEAVELPLYLAVTIVPRLPETRQLVATMKATPERPFGDALATHGLFGHKSPPSIRRVAYLPEYRELFKDTSGDPEVWERSYAIVSPKGVKIAGITEIFSPRLEATLARDSR